MTSSPEDEIPCNRFTFQQGAFMPLSRRYQWRFWDHKHGREAELVFYLDTRNWTAFVWGTWADPMVTEALKKLLPPEELARATALSITGGHST